MTHLILFLFVISTYFILCHSVQHTNRRLTSLNNNVRIVTNKVVNDYNLNKIQMEMNYISNFVSKMLEIYVLFDKMYKTYEGEDDKLKIYLYYLNYSKKIAKHKFFQDNFTPLDFRFIDTIIEYLDKINHLNNNDKDKYNDLIIKLYGDMKIHQLEISRRWLHVEYGPRHFIQDILLSNELKSFKDLNDKIQFNEYHIEISEDQLYSYGSRINGLYINILIFKHYAPHLHPFYVELCDHIIMYLNPRLKSKHSDTNLIQNINNIYNKIKMKTIQIKQPKNSSCNLRLKSKEKEKGEGKVEIETFEKMDNTIIDGIRSNVMKSNIGTPYRDSYPIIDVVESIKLNYNNKQYSEFSKIKIGANQFKMNKELSNNYHLKSKMNKLGKNDYIMTDQIKKYNYDNFIGTSRGRSDVRIHIMEPNTLNNKNKQFNGKSFQKTHLNQEQDETTWFSSLIECILKPIRYLVTIFFGFIFRK